MTTQQLVDAERSLRKRVLVLEVLIEKLAEALTNELATRCDYLTLMKQARAEAQRQATCFDAESVD